MTTMKQLAIGPVMRERSTIPYAYVLRAEVNEADEVVKYVVHMKQFYFNDKGLCNSISYCGGHYFGADQKDKAHLCWAKKVLERLEHNIDNDVAY